MRANEREQVERLFASQQKWQMATILLLDVCKEHGIDMDWVMTAKKEQIVNEILRKRGTREGE